MKCKYCDAQWEEETWICPNCGMSAEDTEERETTVSDEPFVIPEETLIYENTTPKTGMKWWQIALIAFAGVVLGTALTLLILKGCGVELFPAEPTQESTQEPTQESILPVTYDTYYADAQVVKERAGETVAVAGENVLTNGRFQVYYWSTFFTFLQQNGMYFDLSRPLSEQFVTEDTSWEEYFIDSAINNWHCYAVLAQLAEQEGFTLDQDNRDYLDGLPEYLDTLAVENGCANGQELVEQQFGPGATVEDYVTYMREYTTAMEFYNSKYETFLPTDQEIEEYFAEHEEEFAIQGITRESKLVNVRHILIKFQSESGESKEYTDQDKEKCKAEAQAVLEQWLDGEATEESFGLLAQELSEDPGSASNGGLYENVTKNYMTANFDAWIFDESRQFGDSGLVETEYGYHVMFFAGSTLQWPEAAKTNLIAQMAQDLVKNGMDTWPAETKYENLAIGEVDLGV